MTKVAQMKVMRAFRFLSAVFGLVALGLWTSALSAQSPLTLEAALDYAVSRPAVVDAEQERADAERGLARTLADPLALKIDRLQAEQRLELAEARYVVSLLEAREEMAEAFLRRLDSRSQKELAQSALELSEQALAITRIRVENGSAPEIELREAQTAARDAAAGVTAATEAHALARENLVGLLGFDPPEVALVLAADPSLPNLGELLDAVGAHPNSLEVRHGADLAEAALEILDPSYAPRVDIDQAALQREQAERMVAEVRRGLRLQVRSLFLQAQSALESLEVANEAMADAQARLEIERIRHEAGLIADIALRQRELETRSAELETKAARTDALNALFSLFAAAAYTPEVLRGN